MRGLSPETPKYFSRLFRISKLRFDSLFNAARVYRSPEPVDDSPFLRQGWELDAVSSELPNWFEQNRVQGSTRLAIGSRYGSEEFTRTAEGFKILGSQVLMRHVKTGDQDPWWPTEMPVRTDCGSDDEDRELIRSSIEDRETCSCFFAVPCEINVVQEMVREANEQELSMIAYYWHFTECRIASLQENWVCRNFDSSCKSEDRRSRGLYLDLTTGYRKIVLQRLLELAKLGVRGFNFDSRHMPPHGCWGTAFAEEFQRITGSPAPGTIDKDDPIYRQFLDFQAYKVEETFAYWKASVKSKYPDVIFLISTTTIPSLTNRRMTTNLVRIADSAKNEYRLALNPRLNSPLENLRSPEEEETEDAEEEIEEDDDDCVGDASRIETVFKLYGLSEPCEDIRMAFGWTLLRDSSEGRPPRIWISSLPNKDHAFAFAASLITYGAVANMNVNEAVLHDVLTDEATAPSGVTPRDALEAAFALGNRLSPWLSGTLPLRWAVVHFSELARNRRGGELGRAWQEVLWPAVGAFGVFVRQGLPIGIVNDYQLDRNQLEGYRILFLPNPNELTRGQKDTVAQFVRHGGIVLSNPPSRPWSVPERTEEAAKALEIEVENLIACLPAPVQVKGGPEKMHAVVFESESKRRLVIAVTNNFTWVAKRCDKGMPELGEPLPSPAPIKNAVVIVKNRRRPVRIFEVLNDASLAAEPIPNGYRIRLPEFKTMAFLVIEG